MNGIHDLGGLHGFGKVEVEQDEPVFHERWEGRVFGMSLTFGGRRGPNVDAARHRSERLDPVSYFQNGYFGRWLATFEMMLKEEGVLAEGELEDYMNGAAVQKTADVAAPPPQRRPLRGIDAVREVDHPPLYGEGQAIITRNHQPAGHTRLPAYARCRRGVIKKVHPAMVFADTIAHEQGENPQYVYSVEFDGAELWGDTAEPGTVLRLDLFESYLAPM